ncbi:MAG TPA: N-acetyltransferase [bacterium]|nr:N-acetyltransferase [bacterium]
MITVEEVTSGRPFADFVDFPYALYRDDPHWVPPLKRDVKFTFAAENPFWHHAERALFVARRDGAVVGRVAAIKDDDYIEFSGRPCGYFGFFECREDEEAAGALWDAAAAWLREKGLTEVIGPMNPSTNDECAFLVEGFDRPPYIMMTHNPPYYASLAEAYGFRKARDLFAFILDITPARLERLERVAARVRERNPGLVVRYVNLRDFAAELQLVRKIYNRAWEANWGFVPPTREEFESTAKRLKPLVVPTLVPIAFVDGDPAGFIVTVPNYNEVLARMGGSRGPVSLLKFLAGRRKIKSCRVMLFGICPEYRKRGLDAVLIASNNRAALELGYTEAEFSWVLEENEMTKGAAAMLGGRPYKRYRIYEKEI